MRGTAASRISAWGTLVAATVTVPLDSTSVSAACVDALSEEASSLSGAWLAVVSAAGSYALSGWADVPVLEEPQAVSKPAVRTAASANDNAFFFIMSPPFMKYHRPCICIVSPWCLGTGAWLV